MNIVINKIKRLFGFEPTSSASYQKDIISIWRERIFLIIFISTAVVATFIYLITVPDTIQKGWWVNFAVYTLGYISILCIVLFRRIPFKIRAWTGTLIFYIFGVFTLMAFGMVGSGRVYLFAFSIVACLLLKMKGGVIALILNIIAIITVGWLSSAGFLGTLAKIPYTTELWFYYAITFIWLNVIVTISLAIMVQALEESLTKEQKFAGELDAINAELGKDIDIRKKIEETLQESEEKFRLLAKNSIDCIWVLNTKLRFTYLSPSVEKLLGFKPEQMVGTKLSSHFKKKEFFRVGTLAVKAIKNYKTFTPITFETKMLNSKNDELDVEITSKVLLNSQGKLIGLQGTTKVITERKKAEEALQESEHRLLRAQKVAHVGDWEYDVETGVSIWSDELYRIYGFDPAYEIESETMLAGMHPDDRDCVNETLAGWIENGGGETFEYRIVRPDGSIRHVYSPAEVVCDSNGNVVKVYGTALDITDRKNAEESLKIYAEELARSNEELKSLDKMKNDFLSNVSHELKTPLISIKGFSEVVQDELYGPLTDQQKKAMSTVVRNCERLDRLINSILYLTVKKAGKDTYTFVPVNISVIIDNAIIDISSQANSKELTIEQDIAPDLLSINGDMDKLAQVFTNLIENATKFTHNGGKITVKAYNEDENVHITVSDTGIGISNEVISNLFDKFYQVDASTTRRYGGTGIGLYISKLIVEVHNGEIWAESEEGVGTTFHVVLPK